MSLTRSVFDLSLTNGVDWVLPANTASLVVRFGSCYDDGDGLNTTFFAYPTAHVVRCSRGWCVCMGCDDQLSVFGQALANHLNSSIS